MDSDSISAPAELTFLQAPKWRCPRHGITEAVVHFSVPQFACSLCMHCVLEALQGLGVQSVERIE